MANLEHRLGSGSCNMSMTSSYFSTFTL